MSRSLNTKELDILDGPNYPSIAPQVEKSQATEVESFQLNEQQATVATLPTAEQILAVLKEKLDSLKEFDSLSGTTSTDPRQIADSGRLALSHEHAEVLLQELDNKIATLREKSNRLKKAIDIRQELSPTIVEFDPKRKLTIKRGMQRVFGHKANTITYEHYKAAIAARQELSKQSIGSESLTLEVGR
jgi:hypothetical protein